MVEQWCVSRFTLSAFQTNHRFSKQFPSTRSWRIGGKPHGGTAKHPANFSRYLASVRPWDDVGNWGEPVENMKTRRHHHHHQHHQQQHHQHHRKQLLLSSLKKHMGLGLIRVSEALLEEANKFFGQLLLLIPHMRKMWINLMRRTLRVSSIQTTDGSNTLTYAWPQSAISGHHMCHMHT